MYNKDFEEAIASSEAGYLRSKIGVTRANKFIQDTYNAINGTHYCGFDNHPPNG